MTLIHTSDEDISKQALRASRALDIGINSFANHSSRLETFDPLSFYYSGIIENRLLSAYVERRGKKPSRLKWWNFWLVKRSVKKELKNLDFPKEYLSFPKLVELLDTTYTLSVFEEMTKHSKSELSQSEKYTLETPEDTETLISEEPETAAENIESSGVEESVDAESEEELLSVAMQENRASEDSFTEYQLEQLARLLEENALLRARLEETQEKLDSALKMESSTVNAMGETESVDVIEDSPESIVSDEENALKGDTQEDTEPAYEATSEAAKPARPGRQAMPTWDELVADMNKDSISVIGAGNEDDEDSQNSEAMLDEDGLEEVSSATESATETLAVDGDSTVKEDSTTAVVEEDTTEDSEAVAVAGLIEPPEEGFLYEDTVVDTPDENPFAEIEEEEVLAESSELGRQITVEKLVVQQQVTEQSSVVSQQASVSQQSSTAPQAPVAPRESSDASQPIQPPPVAPQAPQEPSSSPATAYPQRPALPVYRPSTPAVQEPVPESTHTEDNTTSKEFVPSQVVKPTPEAPVQPQEEQESVSRDETAAPVEDSVKEYAPQAPAPQPVAEEPVREKQTVHADMDVTADSVNINTKSGDPLADFDPSRYLNLANSMKNDQEEESVEEVEEEEVPEENTSLSENSNLYLLDQSEEMSETAKVNAMLKELKQLRSSGRGGLV
jgi:hypothetical protein